jgi:hypothetical protein
MIVVVSNAAENARRNIINPPELVCGKIHPVT